jgi:hypothetical protein
LAEAVNRYGRREPDVMDGESSIIIALLPLRANTGGEVKIFSREPR